MSSRYSSVHDGKGFGSEVDRLEGNISKAKSARARFLKDISCRCDGFPKIARIHGEWRPDHDLVLGWFISIWGEKQFVVRSIASHGVLRSVGYRDSVTYGGGPVDYMSEAEAAAFAQKHSNRQWSSHFIDAPESEENPL